jgi:hypothetical protein
MTTCCDCGKSMEGRVEFEVFDDGTVLCHACHDRIIAEATKEDGR